MSSRSNGVVGGRLWFVLLSYVSGGTSKPHPLSGRVTIQVLGGCGSKGALVYTHNADGGTW